MAIEVNWTTSAIEDISNIAEFISKDSYQYAQIQSERFPLLGKVVPEFSDSDLRELIEGNYRISYHVITESRIDILTIHHSSRLISSNPLFRE